MKVFIWLMMVVCVCMPLSNGQARALEVDPANDQFEFCKQLYRDANAQQDVEVRKQSYLRLAPRLEQYLQRFPGSVHVPAVMYYLGECYYQSGYVPEAKQVLERLMRQVGEGRYVGLAASRLGHDAFLDKRYQQAGRFFEVAVRMAGDDVGFRYRAMYQQASCYRYSGQSQLAIKTFKEIEKAEDAPKLYRDNAGLRLGYLYYEVKKSEVAFGYFSELVQPGVENAVKVDAALNAGLIAYQSGDLDEAERYLKVVMVSEDEKLKGRAQVALMNVLYANKDYDGVYTVMKSGQYDVKPETVAVKYVLMGRSAYQLEKYQEAIKWFAQAERQVPLSKEAFEAGYYRLLCFFSMEGANIPQQVDGFLQVYQPRFPRAPEVHKALLMKAETLFDNEQFREAAGAYNQISAELVGEKNEANLWYKRGWCLTESGDHGGAVRSFSSFLNKYGDDERAARVMAMRGKSLVRRGWQSLWSEKGGVYVQGKPRGKCG